MAVEVRLTAKALVARDALAVVADFRPGAIPVVEALRCLPPARPLTDADPALFVLLAVGVGDAGDRTLSLPAPVSRQALLRAFNVEDPQSLKVVLNEVFK